MARGSVARALLPAFLNSRTEQEGTVTASVRGASNQHGRQASNAAFPRSARLLRHSDFERVYKLGKRHFSASMTVFYLRRQDLSDGGGKPSVSGLRIGFTVGRALGGAVQRNRMKRRLREGVRLLQPLPPAGADVVINPKKALLTVPFDGLLNELRRAFVVLEKKLGAPVSESWNPEGRSPGSEV